MIDYRNLNGAIYTGPDFPANPNLLNDYKNNYAYISDGMTLAFSMHWLISCLFFDNTPPSDVTKYMFSNSLEYCDGASKRYNEICKLYGKSSADLKTEYLSITRLFVEQLSKWSITTSSKSLVNIDGKDIGKLIKLAELSNQLLLTIYFNPSATESNDEMSHTVAICKFNNEYYLFDPDLGVYIVDNSSNLTQFIRHYFSIYVPNHEINRYSSVEILPIQQNQNREGD